jgi:uncharacterized protein
MLKQLIAGSVIAVMLTGAAIAGPYEDGLAAYKRNDYAEAVKWFRLAAEQGVAQAQYNLGIIYLNGLGVPQDYAETAQWFRQAAEQGLAQAQYNLGVMYL